MKLRPKTGAWESNMKCKHRKGESASSELLILADGKILAHNITPVMAEVLSQLNPEDEGMSRRVNQKPNLKHEFPN